ncbi:Uncharacterized membrane protein [Roseovarius pacificus]|uniref:Uncharacterized membrane protein n=1 Tax=Roseovarius pacificus TaxID=337701 RepID=A0A1M6WYV1_9RHOB|nr:PACE efflux transporter [Roseovarius pacificus]GGO52761.1 membrane protein [Roseovarius pacificus]SHK98952.1 Uncharacterized membrane protein [Roseovarius pacificus]
MSGRYPTLDSPAPTPYMTRARTTSPIRDNCRDDPDSRWGKTMRTTGDRIRHALSFEIIGILLVVPLAATGFGVHLHDVGVVAIAAATLATLWNYIYNLGFDRLMIRWMGTVHKTLPVRVLHAVLFETGLLMVTLPFIAWYLGMGLWQALLMDIAFAVFYLVYAFVFNWSYDQVFPLPKEA